MRANPQVRERMRVRAPRGFTLIEMMVGIAVGLIVLAVATTVFVNVSSSRRDMERTGRQIENGRFAMQLLADDMVNTGYFGEFDPRDVGPPASKPDPCSTSGTIENAPFAPSSARLSVGIPSPGSLLLAMK